MKSVSMNALDMVRMCVFLFFFSGTFFLAGELYQAKLRYDILKYELYNNQKSADDIIHDLRRKLSSVEFIRNETECLAKNIYLFSKKITMDVSSLGYVIIRQI